MNEGDDRGKQVLVKLMSLVDKGCKKCYGRGFVGYVHDAPVVCNCVHRSVKRLGYLSLSHYMKQFSHEEIDQGHVAVDVLNGEERTAEPRKNDIN